MRKVHGHGSKIMTCWGSHTPSKEVMMSSPSISALCHVLYCLASVSVNVRRWDWTQMAWKSFRGKKPETWTHILLLLGRILECWWLHKYLFKISFLLSNLLQNVSMCIFIGGDGKWVNKQTIGPNTFPTNNLHGKSWPMEQLRYNL